MPDSLTSHAVDANSRLFPYHIKQICRGNIRCGAIFYQVLTCTELVGSLTYGKRN